MRTPASYSLTVKMATLESLAMLATLTALFYFIFFFFRINHLRWLPCKVPKMAKHLVTAAWKASRFFWPSRALRMSWFRGILPRVTFANAVFSTSDARNSLHVRHSGCTHAATWLHPGCTVAALTLRLG